MSITDALSSLGAAIQLELTALQAQINTLSARLTKLETPVPVPVPPAGIHLGAVTYYYPGAKWDAVLPYKPAVTIINPASGPGLSISAYTAQVVKAKAAGAKVLGYVYSKYGNRLAAEVKADIDRHKAFYAVDGIFLDECSNSDTQLPYYRDICAYAHSLGLIICLNPGTKTTEGYAQIADYLMVAETTSTNYRSRVAASWETAYPTKLWHVVHSCLPTEMAEMVALAKSRSAALLWVTDDVLPNPYDTNPNYLAALAAELAK